MVHPSGIERSRSTGVAPAAVQTAKKKPPLLFSVEKTWKAKPITQKQQPTNALDTPSEAISLPILSIKQRQTTDLFPKIFV